MPHPVDQIPPNGEWWKEETREAYKSVYSRLLSLGFTEALAIDILSELYHAAANKYQ